MIDPNTSSLALLQAFFASHPSVQFIRLTYITFGNIHKASLISRARALEMARNGSKGVSTNAGSHYVKHALGGQILDLVPHANGYAVPNWKTIRLFAAHPTHATVMCHLPVPVVDSQNSSITTTYPHSLDPRAVLTAIQATAKGKGFNLKVGFEVEFLLIPQSDLEEGKPEPTIGKFGGATASSMLNKSFVVLEESVLTLEESGIEVWPAHQEDAKNHYEIALGPAEPLEAADNLILATELIKTIANKHGYVATMHPKPYEHGPGTGQHIHVSLCNASD